RDTIDTQRHAAVVSRLDRIELSQAETRNEIKTLHERDNQLAVEIERRASRIEGHLGMHRHEGARKGS
ncbi:MAG: hypothetical protein VKL39_24890, partial [Leptolyngbyaceae bacterium]|nr:hypothetical protein [Leptolyngbyaceae bacterium]